MLTSLIKTRFLTLWDQFQSTYITDEKLNVFFWDSQNQIYTDLMAKYQLLNRITDDTIYLVRDMTLITASNLINIDTEIGDFSSLINITPTYEKDDITYTNVAVPLLAEDKNSYYARGSVNSPRFEFYANSSSERILKLLPEVGSSISLTSVSISYFINPVTIDFTLPDYDIPYTDNAVDNIIKKAIQLASDSFHDLERFKTGSIVLDQANQNP